MQTNYYVTMETGRLSQFKIWTTCEDDILKFIEFYNNKKVNIRHGNQIDTNNLKFNTKPYDKYCGHPIYEITKEGIYYQTHQNLNNKKLIKKFI
jgi:hypothetical protein